MSALSSLTAQPRAALMPAPLSNAPSAGTGVLANRLAERLGVSPSSLQAPAEQFTPARVAERVLGFIEQRLQREAADGADQEMLQGLLQQAREGIEQGFAEARKILDGLGVLQGKIATDIDETYARLQDGLQGLQARTLPAGQGVAALQMSSERLTARSETFELQVTTRQGDRLRISLAQAALDYRQTDVSLSTASEGTRLSVQQRSSSLQVGSFMVAVEGDLNEQERGALNDLLRQVQGLSGQFYAGDLAGAFDSALSLNMDGSQLASMSLRLTQTQLRQASDTYAAVAQSGGQGRSVGNGLLADYAQGLLQALRSAETLVEASRELLEPLLQAAFSLDPRLSDVQLPRAEQLNSRLLDGLPPDRLRVGMGELGRGIWR